jgi:polysaccharide export outer membrane protein
LSHSLSRLQLKTLGRFESKVNMKLKFVSVVAFLTVGLLVTLVRAQDPQTPSGTPPTSTTSTSSQQSNLDNQGVKNYLLGPGDVVDVRVFGQPDLSSTAQVDGDGNLSSLPFLETPIPAKCRTEKQIQKDIVAAYSKFINNPQVSVRISERNSRQPATIFGAVRQPTRVEMKRKVRLNEVVAVSGGFTERASGTIQILHTEPLMCPEPGEEAQAAPIDGSSIPLTVIKISELRAGKTEANPVIRPGDYVLVTEAEPVYITGSVVSPGGIYLREQLTLSRALGMVGGARREAKISEIKIYRQKPGSTEQEIVKVDFSAIKKNQKPDVVLQPYDVVDVPQAGALSMQRLPETLIGAVTGGLTSALTTGIPNRVIY